MQGGGGGGGGVMEKRKFEIACVIVCRCEFLMPVKENIIVYYSWCCMMLHVQRCSERTHSSLRKRERHSAASETELQGLEGTSGVLRHNLVSQSVLPEQNALHCSCRLGSEACVCVRERQRETENISAVELICTEVYFDDIKVKCCG